MTINELMKNNTNRFEADIEVCDLHTLNFVYLGKYGNMPVKLNDAIIESWFAYMGGVYIEAYL